MTTPYQPRLLDHTLRDLMEQVPAVLLVGPRGCGKTTTARRHAATIVRLDREAEAAAFRADPDAALRGLERPVLIDEWQQVPGVLGALKRSIDVTPEPGQFLVTGSVKADLEGETWPGTARLLRIPMFGMTVGELQGAKEPNGEKFLSRLSIGQALDAPENPPDLREYVRLCLQGGFPQAALRLSGVVSSRWYESYIEQVVTRDAKLVDAGRDPDRLQRYFEALAANTAGVVDLKTLHDAAGINRKTALAYEQLLKNLYLLDVLPAWTSNRLKRLNLAPKRYLIDSALAAGALRVDESAVMRDGDLLGRLLDTLACAQLRGLLPVAETRPKLFHLRKQSGTRELDLIIELGGGGVIGLEIKASASPGPDTCRHLAWLRGELGDRFVAGVVLHTGPRVYELGERIQAAPIACLWQ